MDISGLSGPKQAIAVAGLRSQLKSQQVLASIVGDALNGAKAIASTAPAPAGNRGTSVNLIA